MENAAQEEKKGPKGSSVIFILIIVIVIFAFAITAFVIRSNSNKQLSTVTSTQTSQTANVATQAAKTTAVPLTTSNVEQALDNMSSSFDQSVNQVNADTQTLDKVDASLDNPNNI